MNFPKKLLLHGAVAAPTAERPAGERPGGRALAVSLPRPRPELVVLLALTAALNLWSLNTNGWANEYYSAAVRSMSTSWHDFLYGSFDAAGIMTVDKPPMALWVQALSVRIFGFHSLSILIPQALMGVAAVGLLYDLVSRRFGRAAGAVAGLALATTPITVAISRHNNPDALLVLCIVAALWAIVRALEDGRARWLVLAGACIGLGFETKMGAALLVVPGLAAAWMWVAPRGRPAALRALVAGGATMAATGLAWPVLVWLTPAGSRPWVSGTADNSIWSLIFGYNGLGRLDGQAGGPAGGGAGGVFGGDTGPLRLLNETMGGQGGWLLGFALVGGVAVLAASRLRRTDPRTGWLIAAGGAFLSTAVAFSFASGIFHPYYVSALAPFTAALVGAGAAQLLSGDRLSRVLAPLAVAAGVVVELKVLGDNPGQLGWLPALLVAVGIAGAVALAVAGVARIRAIALAAVLAVLLIAPATWAAQTLGHATSGTFPAGGPVATAFGGGPGGGGGRRAFGPGGRAGTPPAGLPNRPGAAANGALNNPAGSASNGAGPAGGGGMGGGRFGGSQNLTEALAYVSTHGGGTIAVSSQSGAAGQVITTGADVAAIGGFSGRESQVSTAWLADAVRAGKIRWVLTDGTGNGGFGGQDGRVGSSEVMAAVQKTCTPVSSVPGLYDCTGMAAALAAAA